MAEQIMNLGWWLVPAILVLVLGVGRVARLVTHDTFPPVTWWRDVWEHKITPNHPEWTLLFFCFWCFTPWVTLIAMGWFLLSLQTEWVAWAWWLFWGWMALSYFASIIVGRDEPADS